MRYIKLFEAFTNEAKSNPDYDRVLDLYNEKGLAGMTPEEIAYLKSGGETEVPKSLMEPEWIDCPFVLCVSEDIWKHYQDDLGVNPDGNPDYERDVLKAKWRVFVFTNYEKIRVRFDNESWMWKMNNLRSESEEHKSEDFEYFGMYDSGLLLYTFDEAFPKSRDNWLDFIHNGGLNGAWQDWGEDLRDAIDDDQLDSQPRSNKKYAHESEIFDINMNGKKLSWANIKSEIDRLASSGKLGDWMNNIDIVKDGTHHPGSNGGPDFYVNDYKQVNK